MGATLERAKGNSTGASNQAISGNNTSLLLPFCNDTTLCVICGLIRLAMELDVHEQESKRTSQTNEID